MQTFLAASLHNKWSSDPYGMIYQIWLFENIADRSWYKFLGKLALIMWFETFFMMKEKQDTCKMKICLFNFTL